MMTDLSNLLSVFEYGKLFKTLKMTSNHSPTDIWYKLSCNIPSQLD